MSIIDLICEEIHAKLPAKTKKLLKSQETRENMKSEFGSDAFLDPENKKFPIVNPTTGKIDCKLIYAAYLRSRIHYSKGGSSKAPASYYKNINIKAKKLYEEHNCSKIVNATISESENISLMLFTESFIGEGEFKQSRNLFFDFLE